jgi:hypothetical protein
LAQGSACGSLGTLDHYLLQDLVDPNLRDGDDKGR